MKLLVLNILACFGMVPESELQQADLKTPKIPEMPRTERLVMLQRYHESRVRELNKRPSPDFRRLDQLATNVQGKRVIDGETVHE